MATSRPRPQVIRLTDAAADRIKHVMANAAGEVVGVRVGVKNGGCAGMAYTMEYADKVGPADEVVEDKGVRVLIDPKAILFLLGTEMDYKITIPMRFLTGIALAGGLAFINSIGTTGGFVGRFVFGWLTERNADRSSPGSRRCRCFSS